MVKKITPLLVIFTYVTLSTVYILAVGRTSVRYELNIDLHLYSSPQSPLYLYGGAWKCKIRD